MKPPATTAALDWVALNSRIVPASRATVSVFDRSFQLGDGLFETLRVMSSVPIEWRAHWRRLARSAAWAGIRLPLSERQARRILSRLITRNRAFNAIGRLHLSRGIGARGYSARTATRPLLVVSLHPLADATSTAPRQVSVRTSTFRVCSTDQLIRHKSANRLLYVLARTEAEATGFDDALLLDERNNVTEAVSSNVFGVRNGVVVTPPLSSALLPGITRNAVLRLCQRLGIPVAERQLKIRELQRCDGVFLSVSTTGILEVTQIDAVSVSRSTLTRQLHGALLANWEKAARRSQP